MCMYIYYIYILYNIYIHDHIDIIIWIICMYVHRSQEKYKVFRDVIGHHCFTRSPGVRCFFCYSGGAVNLCIKYMYIHLYFLNTHSVFGFIQYMWITKIPSKNNYHLRMVSIPPYPTHKNHEFGDVALGKHHHSTLIDAEFQHSWRIRDTSKKGTTYASNLEKRSVGISWDTHWMARSHLQ